MRIDLPDRTVDLDGGVVTGVGDPIRLSPRERALLTALSARVGEDLTRAELLSSVWGDDGGSPRRLDTAVRRLRTKIEPDPASPRHLITVHGSGYRLQVPGHTPPPRAPAYPPRRDVEIEGGFVDLESMRVHRGAQNSTLTGQEAALLTFLVARSGRIVPKDALARGALGLRVSPRRSRALDRAIGRLRAKIEPDPGHPTHIETVHGAGIRFRSTAPATNLVPRSDTLIGRQDALVAVATLLRESRVVTVTGPPGVGKTRLAEEVGLRAVDRHAGGVWFCGLADALHPDDLVRAVADRLGATLQDATPQALLARLRAMGDAVLILDNCEHLIEAAAVAVAAWAAHCPALRFLTTSREPLALKSERVFRLSPLSLADAARLYLERSASAGLTGDPSDTERAAIEALMARIEGLPLAIELCAASASVLDAATLVDRRAGPLDLPDNPHRDGPDRHASLHRAIGWSWDGLAPEDQRALVRLTVLHSDFDLAAAHAVLDEADAIDRITSLVRTSWLMGRRVHGALRFGFLASMRAFLLLEIERGDRWDDAVLEARAAHAHHFAEMGTEAWMDHQFAMSPRGLIGRLAPELDDLLATARHPDGPTAAAAARAAMGVLLDRGPIQAARQLADDVLARGDIPKIWRARIAMLKFATHRSDRVSSGADAFALAAEVDDVRIRTRARLVEAYVARDQGRNDASEALLNEALELAESSGNVRGQLVILDGLATLLRRQRRLDEAIRCSQRAVALLPPGGDPGATSRGNLAESLRQAGRLAEAEAAFEEALAAAHRSGKRRIYAMNLSNLALLHEERGDVERALAGFEQATDIEREVGHRRGEAVGLANIGILLADQGHPERARGPLEAAAAIARDVGNDLVLGAVLGALGAVHGSAGDHAAADRTFAEGSATLQRIGGYGTLARLLCRRGHYHLDCGREADARRDLERAEALTPDARAGSQSLRSVQRLQQRLATG